MLSRINKEIERVKKHYEQKGWDNAHERNLAKVHGMLEMLEVVTGKCYIFDENGVTEVK